MSDGNMSEKRFEEIERMLEGIQAWSPVYEVLLELLDYTRYLREELDGTGL